LSIDIDDRHNAQRNPPFRGGANIPLGVAVDGQHVYWMNCASGTIGRADLDGSGVNQSFISGLGADGIAVLVPPDRPTGVSAVAVGRPRDGQLHTRRERWPG
jgi:hypothetical protein